MFSFSFNLFPARLQRASLELTVPLGPGVEYALGIYDVHILMEDSPKFEENCPKSLCPRWELIKLIQGANPIIPSCNASFVKFYNAMAYHILKPIFI
jgi:hypothetical protein